MWSRLDLHFLKLSRFKWGAYVPLLRGNYIPQSWTEFPRNEINHRAAITAGPLILLESDAN